VTIPVKTKFYGQPLVLRTPHVGGFFVNDMPSGCNEDKAKKDWDNQTQECRDYVTAIDNVFNTLTGELHRTAIRDALKSW
jgi:hypothetical protein